MDKKKDYIRPPDQVKIDNLIGYNCDYDYDYEYENIFFDEDYELKTAIETSKNEFNSLQDQLLQQQKERQFNFYNIKIQLNKIISFDKANFRYYELILSIIDMYELCVINEYKTFEKEYNKIFKILKTFRLPNEEIEKLKKIIVCE
jgi:hypothetical protein